MPFVLGKFIPVLTMIFKEDDFDVFFRFTNFEHFCKIFFKYRPNPIVLDLTAKVALLPQQAVNRFEG
jgi:hypothetical protein